jgi:hypothetical protein
MPSGKYSGYKWELPNAFVRQDRIDEMSLYLPRYGRILPTQKRFLAEEKKIWKQEKNSWNAVKWLN